MGITHVVRGEEWISSTPKHLLLYRWLGWDEPAFAHMPLLRNTDRSKISKRKNPAARLLWFREQGYLPEALRNFLQLLGYPPASDDTEVATFDEFVAHFDWAKVNTVGPVFDLEKLTWLNGHYLRALSSDELTDRIVAWARWSGAWPDPTPEQVEILRRATPLVAERMTLLADALPQLDYLFAADDALVVTDDARAQLGADAGAVLDAAASALAGLASFDAASIQDALRAALVEGFGIKPRFAYAPLRIALTGRRVSPPLFESMEILGRDSVLARFAALRETVSP